jgi:hypothetical protein
MQVQDAYSVVDAVIECRYFGEQSSWGNSVQVECIVLFLLQHSYGYRLRRLSFYTARATVLRVARCKRHARHSGRANGAYV